MEEDAEIPQLDRADIADNIFSVVEARWNRSLFGSCEVLLVNLQSNYSYVYVGVP